ncbi:MAG: hypothetical protein QF894_04490, partial [Alphaproteobacteria bacterium]|nr:hypothetical protein [Alphaproteobacteria bacterium]
MNEIAKIETANLNNLYQRALNETHLGDSQAVKSLNQCGEQIRRFAMGRKIVLREDFDGPGLR